MFDFFENDWMVGWNGVEGGEREEEEGVAGEEALIPMIRYGGASFINAVKGEGVEEEMSWSMNSEELKDWLKPEEKEWGKNIKKAK